MLMLTLFAALVLTIFPALAHNAVAATIPQTASAAGREMDRQIAERLGQDSSARGLSLSITTPVDVNDLEASNPLARQMQEEIARWFVQAGYDVQEVRKGRDLLFEPKSGEKLLTRKEKLVGDRSVTSAAIVAGTYVVTPEHVRFNIRVVTAKKREVLAMSTVTLPMTREVAFLARSDGDTLFGGTPIAPTVVTMLP
ncbi:MAG: hypothetical protein LBH65_03420 [Desulfovibrio sp.]|nr:hypothetical protein [Desulfovibrio sp.]